MRPRGLVFVVGAKGGRDAIGRSWLRYDGIEGEGRCGPVAWGVGWRGAEGARGEGEVGKGIRRPSSLAGSVQQLQGDRI